MPSDCQNYLYLLGPIQEINQFIEAVRSGEKCINFDKLIPMPENVTTDWTVENWGTKWEAYQELDWIVNDRNNSSNANIFFLTAWSPPIAFVQKVSAMYPNIIFNLEFGSLGGKFVGTKSFANGEIVNSYNPLWNSSGGKDLRKELDLYYE